MGRCVTAILLAVNFTSIHVLNTLNKPCQVEDGDAHEDDDMSLTWSVLWGWRCHCSCHCHGLRCHDDQRSESRSSSTQRAQWPPRQWEAARGQVDTLTAAQTCKLGGVRMFGIAD